MNPKILSILIIIVFNISKCTPSTDNQVFYQPIQRINQKEYLKDVVRVYMDKFGYFYPDTSIKIDSVIFFETENKNKRDTDTTNGNLYHYFKNQKRLKSLREFYKVQENTNSDKIYCEVENRIIKLYVDSINKKINQLKADQIVFLIHGFNVDNATSGYKEIRDAIKKYNYDSNEHNVYIEIFWDGLKNLETKFRSITGIWSHGQNNTIYTGLSLRNFITRINDSIPLVFITHSVGASVATETLFNTVHKWSGAPDPHDSAELVELLKIRTPDKHRIKLGMLAPAIPGVSTFIDFDSRSPTNISPLQNNIYPIVIGYNPKDFAVSKWFFAGVEGTTTLGCNYTWNHQTEINRVKKILIDSLGYKAGASQALINDVHFTTDEIILGLQKHSIDSYLSFDTSITHLFFKKLFEK